MNRSKTSDPPTDLHGLFDKLNSLGSCDDEERGQNREFSVPEGLERTGSFCGSVALDFKKRWRHFGTDWTDGLCMKTLSASLFMFFATFSSTIALAETARRETGGRIGVSEYLLFNCIAGVLHAVFGTQPLLILRPTGPITAILIQLHLIAKSYDLDFFELLSWTGVFVSLYMAAIAVFDLCYLIRHLTRFTHDLFACFVCTIYITDGVLGVRSRLLGSDTASGLFSLMLFLVTLGGALALDRLPNTSLFRPGLRKLLGDYALSIAIAACVGVSFYCSLGVSVERIPMPDTLQPTWQPAASARQWTVGLGSADSPSWLPFVAAVNAVPVLLLFFVDQNVSSRLTQVKDMKLRKGAYYNSSFLIMALFNVVGPWFGLPFVTGSLPHSPQFAVALTDTTHVPAPPSSAHEQQPLSQQPQQQQLLKRVRENRIAPLLVYGCMGAALYAPALLRAIPEGAVDGTLTFVGLSGLMHGNQFVQRVLLAFTDPAARKDAFTALPPSRVHTFTAVQVGLLALCWAVKLSPYGLAFPVVIALLVPFRSRVLGAMFTPEELRVLDNSEE